MSKPAQMFPKHKPEFNSSLYWVETDGEKRVCWSHEEAMQAAVDMSEGSAFVADYTQQ